ncbi:P22 coat protein - protein 5 domain protein [Ruminococcaceae bacterium OttesenSCG-928-I18]|nr:P22 coat protein - protein 5 domain protein [Ruminococcaceae bacterium OttesenSCG-928-I18]
MSIATFIPQLWSARLLQHLDNALVAKNFFNQEYSGEIQDYGDTVKINQIGTPTIKTYVANADMDSPEELNTAAQELVIDQSKYFNFQVDDVDAAQMRAPLMDSAMNRAGIALAETEDTYLFGLLKAGVVAGNQIGALTIDTPDAAFSMLVKLREILTKSNVPHAGRKVALSPEILSYILEDDRFTGTGGSGAEGTLASGQVGRAMGFDVYEVNTLPTATGVQTVIAGHDLGATFASQIIKTEPYRMEKRFSDGVKGLSVYGAKVLVGKAYASADVTLA